MTFTDKAPQFYLESRDSKLPKVHELSSVFVYRFIEVWGGAKKFYQDFFMTAVSPLEFLWGGLNYNYYDDAALLKATQLFIGCSAVSMVDRF